MDEYKQVRELSARDSDQLVSDLYTVLAFVASQLGFSAKEEGELRAEWGRRLDKLADEKEQADKPLLSGDLQQVTWVFMLEMIEEHKAKAN